MRIACNTHRPRRATIPRALCLAVALLPVVLPTLSRSQTNDVVSREVTLLNDLTDLYSVTDVVSREVSLLNDLESQFTVSGVVSREVSFLNDLADRYVIADVVSREVTLLNDLIARYEQKDAISREVAFENMIHCTGDFNGDFVVTVGDLDAFVFVLLHLSPHPGVA